MKLISVVIPCYNEEGNVNLVYQAVNEVFSRCEGYRHELIFIDNASVDKTPEILRQLAKEDNKVKVIFNNRNFGPIRSPYYGLLQARGDAAVLMAADLQEPPHLIPDFLKLWEAGNKVVAGVKTTSEENPVVYFLRSAYYRTLNAMANIELIEHFTGFGLYDRFVLDKLSSLNDSYPYLRGLIPELGFKPAVVPYTQPVRKHGISHATLYILYDTMMLGLTSHSIVPIRIATICGFASATVSMLAAIGYLLYKLIYWSSFSLGVAPVVIGMFFLFSIQLVLVGLLGEYVNTVLINVLKRPLIIEKERLNFD